MIEVQGVTKRYRDHTAIERVTFSVAKGEVLAFLGPNGDDKNFLLGWAAATASRSPQRCH